MPKITRLDLALVVAEDHGCSMTQARALVDTLFQAMAKAIARGDRIEVRGFGSWTVRRQNAQPNARNPMTG